MTQQLPSLRCACGGAGSSVSPPCLQPHSSPRPPASLLGPRASARQAVCDFTRDWCSWNCPWAGSMHASWKISWGESGLSEGNPLRLLLQRWTSFREGTSQLLPSLGIASSAAQSWGAPVLVPQAIETPRTNIMFLGELKLCPGRRGHQCPRSHSSRGTSQVLCQQLPPSHSHQPGCWDPPWTLYHPGTHCSTAPEVRVHPRPS